MSVTCHVTGLFKAVFIWQIFLAHNTTTMLFLPAGTSKGTPAPIYMYCKNQEALGGMVFSYTDSDGVSKIEHV